MAINNLLIDYANAPWWLEQNLYQSWLVQIRKNKYFILQWQNIGNRNKSSLTIGKLLVERNIWKLWPAKIFKCIGRRLVVIGKQYFTNVY